MKNRKQKGRFLQWSPKDVKEFIITIYNSDTDEEVGTIEGCADKGSNSQTISVTKNQQYYMVATCSPTLKAPYYLYISGKLTNIKVVDK